MYLPKIHFGFGQGGGGSFCSEGQGSRGLARREPLVPPFCDRKSAFLRSDVGGIWTSSIQSIFSVFHSRSRRCPMFTNGLGVTRIRTCVLIDLLVCSHVCEISKYPSDTFSLSHCYTSDQRKRPNKHKRTLEPSSSRQIDCVYFVRAGQGGRHM